MLVAGQMGLALAAMVAGGVFAYNWWQALRHRAPGVDQREAATGAAHLFTATGRRYRKRAFVAWLLAALLILITWLLSAAAPSA